jgi:hypothetical protein
VDPSVSFFVVALVVELGTVAMTRAAAEKQTSELVAVDCTII